MEAPFQLVGCVVASKPAADLIDEFVAQLRRERAVVMTKSVQGASFVRFNAPDTRLVRLACQAARSQGPAALRFGFVTGAREPSPTEPDGINISARSIVLANDLACGAGDGEVLVSPQLAVLLIETGVALRSRQVQLAGGRVLHACVLDLAIVSGGAKPAGPAVPDRHAGDVAGPGTKAPVAAAPGGSSVLLQPSQYRGAPPSTSLHQAEGLDGVFRALMAQAEEMAARQAEVETRQDALLARMTLVDDGSRPARHLAELEAELDAQMERVQGRLDFIEKLEQRVNHLRVVTADIERRLSEQLARRAEAESLKHLCDTLVAQMTEAHEKLDNVALAQARLLPMEAKAEALRQALEQAQQSIGAFEVRLGDLDRSADAVDEKMRSITEREALVRAVQAEVDSIQQISSRTRADLQFLADHRDEMVQMRAKIEDLLGRAADADDQIAAIEAHRKLVEEVQSRANAFTHMLGDIHLSLEMLSEQRAVIEHVGEKLARLDFTVQEGQNTLRALQREREVAERVEQGIKSLRTRAAAAKPA